MVAQILEKFKEIQANVLAFLEKNENAEENFQNLKTNLDEQKIYENLYCFTLFLNLLAKISNNYFHETDFYAKLIKIFSLFKKEIKEKFTDSDLFNIFKDNKKVLLFFLEEKIMQINNYIGVQMQSDKYKEANYPQYFFPEIKKYLKSIKTKFDFSENQILGLAHQMQKNNESSGKISFLLQTYGKSKEKSNDDKNDWISVFSKSLPNDFYENRKIGENEDQLCNLIRKDSIEDFIIFVKRQNYPLKSEINSSYYETNSFLLKNSKITLIEYAAFFGSIQIFQYLFKNGVELAPSIWFYAIHSNNPELIHLLEENHVIPESYQSIFNESIKCHHNDVANYIKTNYLDEKSNKKGEEKKKKKEENTVKDSNLVSLKSYNFAFIQEESISQKTFFYLCKYNYNIFVEYLMTESNLDINQIVTKKVEVDDDFNFTKETNVLHSAIKNGNVNIIKLLLGNEKLDVNYPKKFVMKYPQNEREWNYCLEYLLGTEWYEWHEFTIEGNDIMVEMSPLNYAIEIGNNEIVKLLLANEKIDVNSLSKYSMTSHDGNYNLMSPLHAAVEKENFEITQLLLNNKSTDVNLMNISLSIDPDENGKCIQRRDRTALHIAIEKENIKLVELLLSSEKVDVNLPRTWFKYTDDLDECGSCIFKKEKSALHIALYKENLEIINLLLQHDKIDVNIRCNELKSDIYFNSFEEWNERRAAEENPTFEKSYLWADIPYNLIYTLEENKSEKTPLFVAIEYRLNDVIQLLLQNKNIDVNARSIFVDTDLDFGDINLKNVNRNEIEEKTVLNLAIEDDNLECVKLLLKNENIDIELPTKLTRLPTKIEEQKKCDQNEKEEEKETTPLQIAEKIGNKLIINLLKNHKK